MEEKNTRVCLPCSLKLLESVRKYPYLSYVSTPSPLNTQQALLGIYFPVASFCWTDCIALYVWLMCSSYDRRRWEALFWTSKAACDATCSAYDLCMARIIHARNSPWMLHTCSVWFHLIESPLLQGSYAQFGVNYALISPGKGTYT